ncbi:unnamed protein product [Acanthosepion pharaonis]|uniref:Uncharacterized protein n=1 Tax=Acanthosepion pharaonis TaxID=158019 RepID=A0A812BBP1_ACAPH|nr:unnamed protein product [Sepia pharaonis]
MSTIASTIRDETLESISDSHYVSVMIDGATDSSVLYILFSILLRPSSSSLSFFPPFSCIFSSPSFLSFSRIPSASSSSLSFHSPTIHFPLPPPHFIFSFPFLSDLLFFSFLFTFHLFSLYSILFLPSFFCFSLLFLSTLYLFLTLLSSFLFIFFYYSLSPFYSHSFIFLIPFLFPLLPFLCYLSFSISLSSIFPFSPSLISSSLSCVCICLLSLHLSFFLFSHLFFYSFTSAPHLNPNNFATMQLLNVTEINKK